MHMFGASCPSPTQVGAQNGWGDPTQCLSSLHAWGGTQLSKIHRAIRESVGDRVLSSAGAGRIRAFPMCWVEVLINAPGALSDSSSVLDKICLRDIWRDGGTP